MPDNIDSLKSALKADPSNWEIRYGLIHALHESGETSKAVDLISEVKELPVDDKAIVYAAQSYHILGAHDQAADVYRTALQVNPANQAAKAGLQSLGIDPNPTPIATAKPLSVVPLDDEEDVEIVAKPAPLTTASNVGVTAAPTITKEDTIAYDPEVAELVGQIHEAEEESKRLHAASVKRDRLKAIFVTILVHIILVLLAGVIVQEISKPVAPRLTATTRAEVPSDKNIEQQVLEKKSLKAEQSAEVSSLDVISVNSPSASLSITSMDSIQGLDSPALDTGSAFQPSMSMGTPSMSDSKMMFGQPIEGDVLGVILDVSGSMAEWLPFVVREIDRNFKDAPIVYVNNAKLEASKAEMEMRPIVAEQVIAHYEDRTRTPYWFLWGDLPRKAPQRAVDRLIETFKTRPNQFLSLNATGHHSGDRLGEAMKFLAKENCDSIYIFSDFEDFVNEDHAQELGRLLAKNDVRTYIQPAVTKESLSIKTMKTEVASRTKGRQLPALTTLINPSDELEPLVPKPTSRKPEIPEIAGVTYAKPRSEAITSGIYGYSPPRNSTEVGRYEQPEFDAIFYGPEAHVAIFLKDDKGQYIQHPIRFGYWSRIYRPEIEDPNRRWHRRKFLKVTEPPKFDGKEIVWKMILEEDYKFDIYFYASRDGITATYTAEVPENLEYDTQPLISFSIPRLAWEKQDRYYGFDLPEEGLILEEVRNYCKPNEVVLNLPRQLGDRYESRWAKKGFEIGYNTRSFDTLVTNYPSGVREMTVSGPSFGPRILEARTTSTKVHLSGYARSDSEPWEGFSAHFHRSKENRDRFTKTEGIGFKIK